MKKSTLIFVVIVVASAIFVGCVLALSNQAANPREQKGYADGIWEGCQKDVRQYSDNAMSDDQLFHHCSLRHDEAQLKRWELSVDIFPELPAVEGEFAPGQHPYYLGVWHICVYDTIIASTLDEQELLDFCSSVLLDALSEKWYSENNFVPYDGGRPSSKLFSLLPPGSPTKYAFVLAGQSNMVRNFANLEAALKAVYGPDTLAIKVAVGGSSISQWQRGATIYENAVAATVDAQERGYAVKALLFFQGEKDAKSSGLSAVWKTKFLTFTQHFGSDISYPNIPVVFAQLGQIPAPASDWPYWTIVRNQQGQVLTDKPVYRMVTTQTIGPYAPNDAPHYYDDIIDPSWSGTGYALITQRFMNHVTALVPVP